MYNFMLHILEIGWNVLFPRKILITEIEGMEKLDNPAFDEEI